jgi:hypothetical protein
MTGVELIAAERHRQIEVEGWTPAHDDEHGRGQLSCAGACYARLASNQETYQTRAIPDPRPLTWPWSAKWWKPSADPIRNLVKAGALIAAEIDRLQRKALKL